MDQHQFSQMDLLAYADDMLEKQNNRDASMMGLLETEMPTASGLNDFDYQNLLNLSKGQKQLQQIQTISKIPLPSQVLDHFKHVKCHCMMGLFPDIDRAWLSIDSEIYIWTYDHERDVAYYDGLNQVVLSVGLVRPRRGIFVSQLEYLLVVATTTEIVVLGVMFGDTTKTISSPNRKAKSTATFQEMQLMSKPIFLLSADNASISVIKGTDDGRIFLGARDGCLYEIAYQSKSSWLGSRCSKINHSNTFLKALIPSFLKEVEPILDIVVDNRRQILYTLTAKSSIEVWDLSDISAARHVTKLTQKEMNMTASRISSAMESIPVSTVRSITPLHINNSPSLHLLAVTECGVRLYFSTSCVQPRVPTQTGAPNTATALNTSATASMPTLSFMQHKVNGLYLRHVRLPPGCTPSSPAASPRQVHLAGYIDGNLLLLSTIQQDQDMLWSISSAPFPNRPNFVESVATMPLDGIVWSMGEIQKFSNSRMQPRFRESQKPKKAVFLTNQGVHIVALLNGPDILHQLLVSCQGPQHEAVKNYFQTQTEIEACLTCLLLACSEQYRCSDIAMWAAQAFLLYGGEPVSQQRSRIMHAQQNFMTPGAHYSNQQAAPNFDEHYRDLISSTPYDYTQHMQNVGGGTPGGVFGCTPLRTNMQNYMSERPILLTSARHNSLYIYVSRLLRPIWMLPCIDQKLQSSITQEDCIALLEDLHSIKSFMDSYVLNEMSYSARSLNGDTNGFSHLLKNSTLPLRDQFNVTEEAQIEERRSLNALALLIRNACEMIGLWKILLEHILELLISTLPQEQQQNLMQATFRDLSLSKSELCASLIVALINSYLRDNASVNAISTKLREVCPTLFRHEDAITFKATEIIKQSKCCNNPAEKDEKLRTALQLCKNAAPDIPLSNICREFTYAHFYEGIIDLAVTCATKFDPDKLGISFYLNHEPANDNEGYTYFQRRTKCYQEVHLALDHVYSLHSSSKNQDQTNPALNYTANEQFNKTAEISKIVSLAVRSDDPLLHVAVYEWLMTHKMLSDLLTLAEPTLGEFLQRNIMRDPKNYQLIDLLWKYYEKQGDHAQAARVLQNLATTPNNGITLDQRIEYLARAVICMRNESTGYSASNGVLLKDLEDKLDVARVQKEILDAVSLLPATDPSVEKAVRELNQTIYDVTELYQGYCEPFKLWESKLTLLHCSHHNDPLLIESIWLSIINKAVEGSASPQEKIDRLFTKIEALVKKFSKSGYCFPFCYIIKELEIKACQLRFPDGIVPEKLITMDLDVEILIEYYYRLISMNERIWLNMGNEWHLIQSSIALVAALVGNTQNIWPRTKRRVFGKAQDIISTCLNICYQKPGTDRLQQSLKDLQFRLQRSLS